MAIKEKQEELIVEAPEVNCLYSEIIPIEDLKPNPDNPNIHPKDQIKALSAILLVNGWRHPIVVSNLSGFVVKGHGRLQTALHMKLKEVPVEFQDYADLQVELADMVADNRIAQQSYVDAFALGKILRKMSKKKTKSLGYSDEEIDLLINAVYVPPKKTDKQFKVLETLKMTKEQKSVIGRAVQRYCIKIGKEIEWGEALACICEEWQAALGGGVSEDIKKLPEPEEKKEEPKPKKGKQIKSWQKVAVEEDPPTPPGELLVEQSEKLKFTVQYAATTSLNDETVKVIRQKNKDERLYTKDEAVFVFAREHKGKKVVALVKKSSGVYWIEKIEEA